MAWQRRYLGFLLWKESWPLWNHAESQFNVQSLGWRPQLYLFPVLGLENSAIVENGCLVPPSQTFWKMPLIVRPFCACADEFQVATRHDAQWSEHYGCCRSDHYDADEEVLAVRSSSLSLCCFLNVSAETLAFVSFVGQDFLAYVFKQLFLFLVNFIKRISSLILVWTLAISKPVQVIYEPIRIFPSASEECDCQCEMSSIV